MKEKEQAQRQKNQNTIMKTEEEEPLIAQASRRKKNAKLYDLVVLEN